MLLPADSLSIGAGMNLVGEVGVQFNIRRSIVDRLELEGPSWKFNDMRLIPWAVKNPLRIFSGLKRPDFENGYCYCSKPELRWDGEKRCSPPKGMLFLVYAEAFSGAMVVLDWGWRLEVIDKPGFPECWEDFDRGEIWPLT